MSTSIYNTVVNDPAVSLFFSILALAQDFGFRWSYNSTKILTVVVVDKIPNLYWIQCSNQCGGLTGIWRLSYLFILNVSFSLFLFSFKTAFLNFGNCPTLFSGQRVRATLSILTYFNLYLSPIPNMNCLKWNCFWYWNFTFAKLELFEKELFWHLTMCKQKVCLY